MQNLDPLEDAEPGDVDSLLIDQPGGQTQRHNKDLFVKRGGVGVLGRPVAAIALYTLQTYAPAGGQGYRTSMRGGGPLTTLIAAGREQQPPRLWDLLWPNVSPGEAFDGALPAENVFPWLAATRTSEGDRATTQLQAHPLQAFWSMPRRIRLQFEPAGTRVCGLTGRWDEIVATTFRTKNRGVKYEGWLHPLSPFVKVKTTELPSSVKANPGCLSYRNWLGLVQEDLERGRHPAPHLPRQARP
jgi:CRISPR system Cascade subunit CasA